MEHHNTSTNHWCCHFQVRGITRGSKNIKKNRSSKNQKKSTAVLVREWKERRTRSITWWSKQECAIWKHVVWADSNSSARRLTRCWQSKKTYLREKITKSFRSRNAARIYDAKSLEPAKFQDSTVHTRAKSNKKRTSSHPSVCTHWRHGVCD